MMTKKRMLERRNLLQYVVETYGAAEYSYDLTLIDDANYEMRSYTGNYVSSGKEILVQLPDGFFIYAIIDALIDCDVETRTKIEGEIERKFKEKGEYEAFRLGIGALFKQISRMEEIIGIENTSRIVRHVINIYIKNMEIKTEEIIDKNIEKEMMAEQIIKESLIEEVKQPALLEEVRNIIREMFDSLELQENYI